MSLERGSTNGGAERFIGNSLTAVLHNYPYMVPYMQELAGFDPETFKHSICVAEIAARTFNQYAIRVGLPKDQLQMGLTTLALGGFLHDIGKTGIDQTSLEASENALHPEKLKRQKILLLGGDIRTADERALIHNHPTIGGYMIRKLCNELPINKKLATNIYKFSFNHHEKPLDLAVDRSSYSRRSSDRNSSFDALLHTILSLSDIAVSMREPRLYRNYKSLPLMLFFQN